MKAAQISNYGDISAVHITEVDKPVIAKEQVLVEVHASSINPVDTIIRAGYMKEMMPLTFPATLGGDVSGTVLKVDEGVSGFKVGDKVYGQALVVAGNSGAFAEYVATAAGQLAVMPENLDFTQAGSLPLVGASAWQALTQHIQLKAGQKIFIHGGSGGIGSIAIQLAKGLGAHVATTATGDGVDFVKQLGADEVIDYKAEDFATKLSNFDAVFDTVGGDDFNKSLDILKKGGIAVSMAAQADEAKATERGVTALYQQTNVTTEALDALRQLVESGAIKPQVDKVFPLEQITQAFEAAESGSMRGKVVVEIR